MLNKSFWMLQPDTYWRDNLFDVLDVTLNSSTNVFLDVEGESALSSKMIAGGNFFVKSSQASSLFFHQLSTQIRIKYTTDNNVMGALCSKRFASVKCEYIPYHTISNWIWNNYKMKPSLMQFDSLILPGTLGKLERMHKAGAKFVHPDGTCVSLASTNVSTLVAFDQTLHLVLLPSHFNFFHFAHGICESICHFFPFVVDFLLERDLPMKGCFYNSHGFACCNAALQNLMEDIAKDMLNNGTFHRCNVQKVANVLQEKCEETFGAPFETIVGLSDYAERIHFKRTNVCKVEINGRYILAYETPDDTTGLLRRKRNDDRDDIHAYNY
ncbi:unnamed protein product [Caenorhabditis bovis]|uniref:Uncharacterized protein n=1 Tax=Caenorhabditis bovis TaxID=2654633 RepID=A0A8S1ELC9_9PELO|nr:unnamed protein product [Caenorhabditis bovis]